MADGGQGGPTSLEDAHESAADAAGWIQQNWAEWVTAGLRILLIAVIAVLLRHVVRRSISRLIQRVNRRAEAADSANALRGLLVSGERRRQRSQAIGSVLRSIASFVIIGTALLMVLSDLGINLAPLLASAGVAGVALGFGARDIVTDLLAGIFMLLEDQYGVGDRVDVGEVSGTVLEIGLRVTQLRGGNGEIWYVRNGEIKRVGNLSQGWATAAVDVRVAPDADLDEVREAVVRVGEELGRSEPWDELLWEPVEVLGLDSVTLDEMVVRVSAKTMPGKALTVERELRWRIKHALDHRGIRSTEESASLEPGPAGPEDAAAQDGAGAAQDGAGARDAASAAAGAGVAGAAANAAAADATGRGAKGAAPGDGSGSAGAAAPGRTDNSAVPLQKTPK
ncbi:mechanosensitive ion channel family protein [Streptomyces sp. Amel2xB2]|uniref:mechanosensitive ion channel family protein n=1 Tax=Streptomyces sp. Amel2xB2 TaxID=1305829 RepID=UPI0021AC9C61|nr:mechanosensitive ion channel family protein [Streptomyces sp. Amel2xB2]